MTNKEFIQKYFDGFDGVNGHCGAYNGYFVNYSTCIGKLDKKAKTFYINDDRYSSTTSRIQTLLKFTATQKGYKVITVNHKALNGNKSVIWWNYGYQGAPNCEFDDIVGIAVMNEFCGR